MSSVEHLSELRRKNWCQDGNRRVENPEQAAAFIERVGVATLYAASPEFPSLYQAHMGEPDPPSFASWDSPSGYVYTWRWELGRPHAAFYGVVVAKKPTWVAFRLLTTVLGALMERRSPEELYEAGELTGDALRLVSAFNGSAGILTTKELRDRGGFSKGKENRSAYLKAIEELDSRLWLAKRCGTEGDEMSHAWVASQYAEAYAEGMKLDRVDALASLLSEIVCHSMYLNPKPLKRHLRASNAELDLAIERLIQQDVLVRQNDLFVCRNNL